MEWHDQFFLKDGSSQRNLIHLCVFFITNIQKCICYNKYTFSEEVKNEYFYSSLRNSRDDTNYIEWVHALGATVEIELKMNRQGCKEV